MCGEMRSAGATAVSRQAPLVRRRALWSQTCTGCPVSAPGGVRAAGCRLQAALCPPLQPGRAAPEPGSDPWQGEEIAFPFASAFPLQENEQAGRQRSAEFRKAKQMQWEVSCGSVSLLPQAAHAVSPHVAVRY